jgi:hypothetical protein
MGDHFQYAHEALFEKGSALPGTIAGFAGITFGEVEELFEAPAVVF